MTPDHVLMDVAERRVRRKAHYPDRKRGGAPAGMTKDEVQRRFIGLCGEREVARIIGAQMNLDDSPRGDRRENLLTPRGAPVDVQTRTVPSSGVEPDLLLNATVTPYHGMALVLVVMREGMTPDVVGWAWEWEIRERGHRVRYSANESFALPQAELHPISTLAHALPWDQVDG